MRMPGSNTFPEVDYLHDEHQHMVYLQHLPHLVHRLSKIFQHDLADHRTRLAHLGEY